MSVQPPPGSDPYARPQAVPGGHYAQQPAAAGGSYAPGAVDPYAYAGAPGAPPEHDDPPPSVWALRVAKGIVVFVYAVVVVCLVMLILGFFLRLFGASTDAEFTRWVYRNVDRIMEPFRGMFPSKQVGDQSVLDVSLLFAMIVYSMVALALHGLIGWLSTRLTRLTRPPRRARPPYQAYAPAPAAGPAQGPPAGTR
jgi:uncharacterized protein YggT (Ycf19 family)